VGVPTGIRTTRYRDAVATHSEGTVLATPAKKSAAAKSPAKKTPAKKVTAAKKTPAKKAPAKKVTAAERTPGAKPEPAGTEPAKQPPVKKAAAATKRAPAAAKAPKKKPSTSITEAMSRLEIQIPVERQKAAQAAGNFELDDLPGALADPAAAIRIGKNVTGDKPLKLVRTLVGITKLKPGQVIANYGKSEAKWATDFSRRRAGKASFMNLLSYSRQIIGIDSQGRIRICLMGHAGQGQSIPLWVVRDEVVLTIQPNDIIMRFEGVEIEE